MKTRFFLFLLIFSAYGYAQIAPIRSETTYAIAPTPDLMPNQLSPPQDYFGSNSQILDALNPHNNDPNSPNYVEGSPLGFEGEANTLVIHTVDDKYYKFDNGNYNGMSDKLVIKLDVGKFYEFNDNDIVFALINNKKVLKLKDEDNEMKYFFVLDESNEYTILKRIKAKIIKGNFSKMTKERISNDKYFVYNDFYLLQNDKLEEIKLNNKTFKMLFKDHGKQLKKYVEENELSIKDEQDFLQMLRYNKTL
ncbi:MULTISPECIES: hypothetical protein [Bizionia]|uniref:Uncharacterized protein n=1 Tax=Bizionia algoritergicola TaxID=291187 RepID=A0A5D0QNA7_9FLAO|nr:MULTISPECIES: hypothetical protein [Bizionia]OBX22396.1 hypothetical protein BAA08_09035 [Bizionia sp. APA-3]TYB70613.1 hypothetical protein ES675_15690 [Bizionia algoritergicola]